MFLRFKDEVASVLSSALAKAGFEIDDLALHESPHADIASSVAFRLAPEYKRNPKEICEAIYKNIRITPDSYIERAEMVGPYINFFVSRTLLNETVLRVLLEREDFGVLEKKGAVILEHTSANPDGPLHIGHIRNSVIGDTLARILKRAGYDVRTQYYINDMGRQIAVVVWGLMNFEFDKTKKPDHAIAEIYINANKTLVDEKEHSPEVDALMKKYENGDPETVQRFKDAIDTAMHGIEESLRRMNISHDEFIWESRFVRTGDVSRVMERIKKLNCAMIKDGALMVDLKDMDIQKPLVVQRSDGTSLYTTRDLAYHEWKAAMCDRMIDILGADHKLISSQLKAVLRLLGLPEPEIVIFEFVSLPEGSMSTRRGVFISADELLDEVERAAYSEVNKKRPDTDEEFKKKVAAFVSIGAVRYDIIRVSPDKATTFDWREALDFEKQGAPFIQYAHARACSIIKNAQDGGIAFESYDPNLLVEEQETALIKKLASFDSTIDSASRGLKPHIVAIYARELADVFNQFYKYVPVLSAEPEFRAARLALVDCSRIVLANALDTLGIAAPESM
ncbi:arginyl-tRNA synthetase [Candidatus Methanoperedens nitroreducens]|uniref:Arginine--tRNA ligase n=1 Tax=Candidatus Methanoperedens nitratireducens TaxID=1392998 RepID=A0A062UY06_9EURY|nr:arginine--tRNA ligase [Candidatus Methanoperedens nitroreducens]KCZ71846.1 arginyl-tRNA synthetase [Candidatus Methanoperedens nitroreducens]MDJ1422179.1 arginine--tRNA ligase [Candidatus Methanoperedens sp.]